jgi:hypothetical protein
VAFSRNVPSLAIVSGPREISVRLRWLDADADHHRIRPAVNPSPAAFFSLPRPALATNPGTRWRLQLVRLGISVRLSPPAGRPGRKFWGVRVRLAGPVVVALTGAFEALAGGCGAALPDHFASNHAMPYRFV